jgi:hypothetical protein
MFANIHFSVLSVSLDWRSTQKHWVFWTKSINPVILSVIRHHQNPLLGYAW